MKKVHKIKFEVLLPEDITRELGEKTTQGIARSTNVQRAVFTVETELKAILVKHRVKGRVLVVRE